jgi:hypothetical protein
MISVQPGPWEQKLGYLVTQVGHILAKWTSFENDIHFIFG